MELQKFCNKLYIQCLPYDPIHGLFDFDMLRITIFKKCLWWAPYM